VRWALSADKELCERGGTTDIRYDTFFKSTKAVAATLHTYPEGRETLKQWNNFVFRGHALTDQLVAFTAAEDDDLASLLSEINSAAMDAAMNTPPPSDDNSSPPDDEATPPAENAESSTET
jgi:hypothetical protein